MKALTIILGLLIVATLYHAWFWKPGTRSTPLDKQGQLIARENATAEDVAALTVATWDDEAGEAKVFAVKQQGGRWIIPSHFDYPADGGTRVGRTAGLLATKRGRFVTDDPQRFEDLGVIDPTSEPAAKAKERGKRVTLKDASGGNLLDLIVGKYDTEGGAGEHFVREEGSNEVYTAKVDLDVSTKFIDWVEADLLKLKRDDLRSITVRDYSVDEAKNRIETRAETALARTATADDWTSPQTPAEKRVAKTGVDALLGELTGLRLAGIRQFRPQLIMQAGFFLLEHPEMAARKGALVLAMEDGSRRVLIANEGEMAITTREGLVYHLFFGEIAPDEEAKEKEAKDAKPEDKPKGHNRYMVVFVTYDRGLDEEVIAAENAKPAEGQPKPDVAGIVAKRQKAVEKANQRFNAYFYVISDASFQNLRPNPEKLFEAKPPEPMAGATGKTVKQWLEENGRKPGVTTTPSGLQYEVLARGAEDGKQPTDADRVRVKYQGTLIDGTQFDANDSADFGVTQVIKGWTEALKLMRPGDKWRLTIPPEIGYGENGSGEKIPGNSILIFEVELLAVNP